MVAMAIIHDAVWPLYSHRHYKLCHSNGTHANKTCSQKRKKQ